MQFTVIMIDRFIADFAKKSECLSLRNYLQKAALNIFPYIISTFCKQNKLPFIYQWRPKKLEMKSLSLLVYIYFYALSFDGPE